LNKTVWLLVLLIFNFRRISLLFEEFDLVDIVDREQMASNTTQNDQQYDVMISYQWDSKDMCLRINESLKAHGYKVWIDEEQMHSDINDRMAEGVENSRCVLLCVTKKYKESKNCQMVRQFDQL
jgi:hypothetical protein